MTSECRKYRYQVYTFCYLLFYIKLLSLIYLHTSVSQSYVYFVKAYRIRFRLFMPYSYNNKNVRNKMYKIIYTH